jgi:hypothetical protein
LFTATVSPTVPLEFPLCPDDTTIQLFPLDAVQLQPLSVETSTDRCPPPDPIASLERLSANRHGAAA